MEGVKRNDQKQRYKTQSQNFSSLEDARCLRAIEKKKLQKSRRQKNISKLRGISTPLESAKKPNPTSETPFKKYNKEELKQLGRQRYQNMLLWKESRQRQLQKEKKKRKPAFHTGVYKPEQIKILQGTDDEKVKEFKFRATPWKFTNSSTKGPTRRGLRSANSGASRTARPLLFEATPRDNGSKSGGRKQGKGKLSSKGLGVSPLPATPLVESSQGRKPSRNKSSKKATPASFAPKGFVFQAPEGLELFDLKQKVEALMSNDMEPLLPQNKVGNQTLPENVSSKAPKKRSSKHRVVAESGPIEEPIVHTPQAENVALKSSKRSSKQKVVEESSLDMPQAENISSKSSKRRISTPKMVEEFHFIDEPILHFPQAENIASKTSKCSKQKGVKEFNSIEEPNVHSNSPQAENISSKSSKSSSKHKVVEECGPIEDPIFPVDTPQVQTMTSISFKRRSSKHKVAEESSVSLDSPQAEIIGFKSSKRCSKQKVIEESVTLDLPQEENIASESQKKSSEQKVVQKSGPIEDPMFPLDSLKAENIASKSSERRSFTPKVFEKSDSVEEPIFSLDSPQVALKSSRRRSSTPKVVVEPDIIEDSVVSSDFPQEDADSEEEKHPALVNRTLNAGATPGPNLRSRKKNFTTPPQLKLRPRTPCSRSTRRSKQAHCDNLCFESLNPTPTPSKRKSKRTVSISIQPEVFESEESSALQLTAPNVLFGQDSGDDGYLGESTEPIEETRDEGAENKSPKLMSDNSGPVTGYIDNPRTPDPILEKLEESGRINCPWVTKTRGSSSMRRNLKKKGTLMNESERMFSDFPILDSFGNVLTPTSDNQGSSPFLRRSNQFTGIVGLTDQFTEPSLLSPVPNINVWNFNEEASAAPLLDASSNSGQPPQIKATPKRLSRRSKRVSSFKIDRENEDPSGQVSRKIDRENDDPSGQVSRKIDRENEDPSGLVSRKIDRENDDPSGQVSRKIDRENEDPSGQVSRKIDRENDDPSGQVSRKIDRENDDPSGQVSRKIDRENEYPSGQVSRKIDRENDDPSGLVSRNIDRENEDPSGQVSRKIDRENDDPSGQVSRKIDRENEDPSGQVSRKIDRENDDPSGLVSRNIDRENEDPSGQVSRKIDRDNEDPSGQVSHKYNRVSLGIFAKPATPESGSSPSSGRVLRENAPRLDSPLIPLPSRRRRTAARRSEALPLQPLQENESLLDVGPAVDFISFDSPASFTKPKSATPLRRSKRLSTAPALLI